MKSVTSSVISFPGNMHLPSYEKVGVMEIVLVLLFYRGTVLCAAEDLRRTTR